MQHGRPAGPSGFPGKGCPDESMPGKYMMDKGPMGPPMPYNPMEGKCMDKGPMGQPGPYSRPGSPGGQGFDGPPRCQSWEDGSRSFSNYQRRMQAAFEFFGKLGVRYYSVCTIIIFSVKF